MSHVSKIAASKVFIARASVAVSKSFPAWIDSSDGGVVPVSVVPRVRDNLVLRLVAGRSSGRPRASLHAAGMP